ncbi:hypothetical protein MCAG_03476 [Micromonospora sp. ATCC 39149]|uniref:DUF4190 domain-containing protein n=1 Tax=Micromonospora carbonacea TaxID=47853 RepID=A0A7D6CF54_9ACTN|nr:DUF4190 domain-containing protein [Micromonospora sp. ATCC 39149]EEP73149.1 hypothetical protein MCAG_03476 [Micromonospora sp. ATCC 39149]QLJ99188.1 DUF4190 domain-containing protein [Micromonospora carbonacea]
MTYPPPAGGPNDPWSQPSTPPVDPTLPVSGQPTGGDPYAPAPVDPYAGMKMEQAAPVAGPYAVPGYAPAGYPAPGYPGYGYPPAQRTNGMAVAALVLALVGVASCITAPIGAILGHVARKQIRETGEGGAGMAQAAIIVGWILTGLLVLLITFYVVMIVLAITMDTGSSGY